MYDKKKAVADLTEIFAAEAGTMSELLNKPEVASIILESAEIPKLFAAEPEALAELFAAEPATMANLIAAEPTIMERLIVSKPDLFAKIVVAESAALSNILAAEAASIEKLQNDKNLSSWTSLLTSTLLKAAEKKSD